MTKTGFIVGLVAAPFLLAAGAHAQGITSWFRSEPVQVVGPPPAAPPALFAPALVAEDPAVQMVRVLDAIMDRGFGDDGFAQLIAQQDAVMRQLIGQMNGMLPAGGAGMCSQVVTIAFDGSGQPQMTVRQSGSACGPLHQDGTVPATAPAPAEPATPPRLIQIDHRQVPQPKPIYRG